MAQTRIGARKAAAKAIGLQLDEFLELSATQWHCQRCKLWKPKHEFGRDNSRWNGIARRCFACVRVEVKKNRQGQTSAFRGRKHSEKSRRLMSDSRLGNKNRVGKRHTITSIIKMSHTRRALNLKGPRVASYIDGRSVERRGMRRTLEYARWRLDVFRRDRFTCQGCGVGRGGNLQAHHILPFAKFPELRFNVANGITLCWDCHDRRHATRVGRRRTKARGQLSLLKWLED
jgi:5-methylcytosine-specific restriction endonuclease McrA